jgi:hypothetical protein
MNDEFRCPACGTAHADPADASLGVMVLCWDCQLTAEPETIAPALRPAA